MLITGLLSIVVLLVSGIFSSVLSVITIPESLLDVLATITRLFVDGFSIVRAYTHWSYISVLFFLAVDIEILFFTYKVIMWVLRKIPFLNIK